MNNNALTLYQNFQNPIQAIEIMAEWAVASGFFNYTLPQAKLIATKAITEGLPFLQVAFEYDVISGRLAQKPASLLARFRAKGGRHRVIRRDAEEASVELSLDGQTQVFSFSFEDAKKEPFIYSNKVGADGRLLLKTNWATPRIRMQMLWQRVIGDAVRTMAPEIAVGIYTPAEAEDMEPETTVTVVAPLLSPQPRVEAVTPQAALPASPQSNTVELPAASPGAVPERSEASGQAVGVAAPAQGGLDAVAVAGLTRALGDRAEDAFNWCVQKGWIENDWTQLAPNRADKIIARPADFIRHMDKTKTPPAEPPTQ